MPKFASYLLSFLGAGGFILFEELSIRRPDEEFVFWSLVTAVWTMLMFVFLAFRRLQGRLFWVALPTVWMICLSGVLLLLFLDKFSPQLGFIVFFAVVLYLFFEHVRHETAAPSQDERLYLAEYSRMINIGSMFLIASVGLWVTIFTSVFFVWAVLAYALLAALWSWHLYSACTSNCGRPWSRVLLTTLLMTEGFLVVLRLPTSVYVGGAALGVVYYLAANLLPIGATESVPVRSVRRYFAIGVLLILALMLTARWVE